MHTWMKTGLLAAALTMQLMMGTAQAAVLAPEQKIIYTTAKVVPFTFTGFTRPAAAQYVLEALRATHSRATFFVDGRDISRHKATVDKIVASGNEIGIAILPKPEQDVNAICAMITDMQNRLERAYGIRPTLVKQPYGKVEDKTREAVARVNCQLIGNIMNIVRTPDKDVATAEELLPRVFGRFTHSVGRGWVINIRTDYYTNEKLAADAFLYIKRKKVDNIAYNSYHDLAGVNPANDSAYRVDTVGSVLAQQDKLWQFPVPPENYLPDTGDHVYYLNDEEFYRAVRQRYIGAPEVDEHDRMLDFDVKRSRHFDNRGVIKTDEPVVFLTFDDWGTDAAINKLLYVLKKHNVPGTFFILTHNVLRNPNLLRAIAMDGHTIASHTNLHKPMAVRDEKHKQVPTMTPEEYYQDLKTSYERLQAVVGDVEVNGHPLLTHMFRPPTLAISRLGLDAVFRNDFDYVVNGNLSSEDYAAPNTETLVKRITDGLFYRRKVRKGAVIVMHMSDAAQYTAQALDSILTENEKRPDGDPAKFYVGRLEEYLTDGYQQVSDQDLRKRKKIQWW